MKNESSFNYIKSFIDVSLNISFWETLLVHASDNDTILLNQKLIGELLTDESVLCTLVGNNVPSVETLPMYVSHNGTIFLQ